MSRHDRYTRAFIGKFQRDGAADTAAAAGDDAYLSIEPAHDLFHGSLNVTKPN
jgi:hypothetical protein